MSHYASELIGKTITTVRDITDEEYKQLGWYKNSNPTAVLEFSDDTYAIVMADPEGNGTGFLDIGEYA
jgi:hypothetical protein